MPIAPGRYGGVINRSIAFNSLGYKLSGVVYHSSGHYTCITVEESSFIYYDSERGGKTEILDVTDIDIFMNLQGKDCTANHCIYVRDDIPDQLESLRMDCVSEITQLSASESIATSSKKARTTVDLTQVTSL